MKNIKTTLTYILAALLLPAYTLADEEVNVKESD